MNPWPVEGEVEESHLPRPGHADLAGALKFGHGVQPRAPARGTRGAGSLARSRVSQRGRGERPCHVVQIASVSAPERDDPGPEVPRALDDSPVRSGSSRLRGDAAVCRSPQKERVAGGKFEVRAFGLVPGVGSHVSWSESRRALAAQLRSIQSVRRFAGRGWRSRQAWLRGTMTRSSGRKRWAVPRDQPSRRPRGRMTTGEPLEPAAIKLISTMTQPCVSRHETKEPAQATRADRFDGRTRGGGRRRGRWSCYPGRSSGAAQRRPHRRRPDASAYKERIGWRGSSRERPHHGSFHRPWPRARRGRRTPPRSALGSG